MPLPWVLIGESDGLTTSDRPWRCTGEGWSQIRAPVPTAAATSVVPGELGAMTEVPRIVVLSSLFPSTARPAAGLFIRERMFRVARRVPLVVVSPQPCFPCRALSGACTRFTVP